MNSKYSLTEDKIYELIERHKNKNNLNYTSVSTGDYIKLKGLTFLATFPEYHVEYITDTDISMAFELSTYVDDVKFIAEVIVTDLEEVEHE